jgi:hypothetical protein
MSTKIPHKPVANLTMDIGTQITTQQFGVANKSDSVWFGIMGLGYGNGNGFLKYNTLVDSLKAQGRTNSKLFSLDLGSQPTPSVATTGEIVFGGVDKNKFAGNLARVATDPTDPYVFSRNFSPSSFRFLAD